MRSWSQRILLHARLSSDLRKRLLEEVRNLKESRTVGNKSRLLKAPPFIDDRSLLRVGGRLHYADAPFDACHPIISPRDYRLTKLKVRRRHAKLSHTSVFYLNFRRLGILTTLHLLIL